MLFDTHAHYDDERFDADRDELLRSMPENGVGLILNPGCDVETSRKALSYARTYPHVYAAVGFHPENIEGMSDDAVEAGLKEIEVMAADPRVRAIGEIGLDYYWCKDPAERKRLMDAADIVLMKSDLLAVADAVRLSKSTMRIIKQNLFWAFGYNTLGIPVAAGLLYAFGGPLLSPMIGAAAMSLSSVSVLSNALRLRRFK